MVFNWSLSSGGMAHVSMSDFRLTKRRQRPKFLRIPLAKPERSPSKPCTRVFCNYKTKFIFINYLKII